MIEKLIDFSQTQITKTRKVKIYYICSTDNELYRKISNILLKNKENKYFFLFIKIHLLLLFI